MTEQQMLQMFLSMLKAWGPEASIIIGVLIYQIFYARQVKKEAVDPLESLKDKMQDQEHEIEKLRSSKGDLYNELGTLKLEAERSKASLQIELQKKANINWIQNQLVPRLDKLTIDLTALDAHFKTMESLCSQLGESIKTLNTSISTLSERIVVVEQKVANK